MPSSALQTTASTLDAGIMATSSVPYLNMSSGWYQSSQPEDQNSLELGMSGMSLMEATKNTDSGDSAASPASPLATSSMASRPQHGMNNSVPSPMVKPGHSKSSSISTSQSVTLTPTSSIDGASSDLYGMAPLHEDGQSAQIDYNNNRRGKEEHDLPSRITTVRDGFDGLPSLRERAHTSPGPLNTAMSSSSRNPSSSRPPLSGSSYVQDSGDSRAPGIISRPGYGFGDQDGPLRRSTSTDTGRESLLNSYPNAAQGHQSIDHQQHLVQKFGSLPTLGSHINQKRLNPNQQAFHPGHQFQPLQRSLSQPGPDYGHHYRGGGDFGGGMPSHNEFGLHQGGVNLHRRSSLQLPNNGSGYHGQQSSTPIIASNEEMMMFSNSDYERGGPGGLPRHERMASPGHSPHQTHYGSHSRHLNDMGVRGMGGQPQSMYVPNLQGGHHRVQPVDEDLSHPLAGENIEVPADDHAYLMSVGASAHHVMRSSGRSGSIDGAPPHYGNPETAHHLPTAGTALPLPKGVYSVKFKRTQRSFVIGPRLSRDLKIGTYVKVEADRGEDLGIVVGKVSPEKQGRSNFRGEAGMTSAPGGIGGGGAADLKRIIRLATHDEVSLLSMKREEEEELLSICRAKVRQRGLPMNVVDAEYQFDRHKLTFFFEAEGRVDFRELVRDLFSMYKTRIWMQQLDKNTSAACHAVVTPPAPVVMDYGTPIIAPVSEFREFVTDGSIETD